MHKTHNTKSSLILPSHALLSLLSGLFPSGLPSLSFCPFLFSPIRVCATCLAYSIFLVFITWIIFGVDYTSWRSSLRHFLSPYQAHISSSATYSQTSSSSSNIFKRRSWTAWPLKMGQIGCSKTSVTNYKFMLCNIPEEQRSQSTFLNKMRSVQVKHCFP